MIVKYNCWMGMTDYVLPEIEFKVVNIIDVIINFFINAQFACVTIFHLL